MSVPASWRRQVAHRKVGPWLISRSAPTVQALLGHSSPIVTQRYAHLSTKALQEAASAASVIVKPATSVPRLDAANAPLVVADLAAETATPQAVVTAAESESKAA